jgi:HD-GYP domain-containing protein (c-di-GMP phosphodiesterase class II)
LQRDLEVLIPVFVPGATGPVAVYDVVSKLADLRPALAQLRRSLWTSIVLGVLLLYAMLFSLVHQASGDLVRQQAQLGEALLGTIHSLAKAVDARDSATGDHSSRVAEYAEGIAGALSLSPLEIRQARAVGFLHDVGKIGIPDAILNKPGPLTAEERLRIEKHPVGGYEILRPVPIPEPVKLGVRHSHESWDGSGYPDGLSGNEIPLLARVVAVADAYEALTTARRYHEAWTPEAAVEEIRRCSGRQFDPQVVEAFLTIWAKCPGQTAEEPSSEVLQLTRSSSG